MDLLEIRRRLLMMGGDNLAPWKCKHLTAGTDYTNTLAIKNWIEPEIVGSSVAYALLDNDDSTTWANNQCLLVTAYSGVVNSIIRKRDGAYQYIVWMTAQYDAIIQQGATITIFYQ